MKLVTYDDMVDLSPYLKTIQNTKLRVDKRTINGDEDEYIALGYLWSEFEPYANFINMKPFYLGGDETLALFEMMGHEFPLEKNHAKQYLVHQLQQYLIDNAQHIEVIPDQYAITRNPTQRTIKSLYSNITFKPIGINDIVFPAIEQYDEPLSPISQEDIKFDFTRVERGLNSTITNIFNIAISKCIHMVYW